MKKQAAPSGWCFYSADFSLQAYGMNRPGTVTYVRNDIERERWHALSDEQKERTPLFVFGRGYTLPEAMIDAEKKLCECGCGKTASEIEILKCKK